MKRLAYLALLWMAGALVSRGEFDRNKAAKRYAEVVQVASRYPFREFEKAVKVGDVPEVKRLLDAGVPVS